MKKTFIVLLISILSLTVTAQDPVHPALCHKFTNEPYPAFFSIATPFDGFDGGDWIGVYGSEMKCYGAQSVAAGFPRGQFYGCGDDPETVNKDGFAPGERMHPFIYDVSAKKFYKLQGTFTDHRLTVTIDVMIYGPLSVYKIDNAVKGEELQLIVDPDLSAIVFNWIDLEYPIVTGGSDAIKLKFIHKNTTAPMFTVAVGKGTVEKRWDGYYYKYAATDVNVVINAIGQNNFTGLMVTDKLTLVLDQSVSANSIFEDENVVLFTKAGTLWVKAKTGKAAVTLYWYPDNVEKKLWNGMVTGEKKLIADFARWKGQSAKILYYQYIDGKMVKTPTIKTFTY